MQCCYLINLANLKMKTLKRIWRGAGYLEGYGYHPGTGTLLITSFMCGIAGAQRGGLAGFIGGFVVGLCVMGLAWIVGCHERARNYELDVERTMRRLQKEYT